MDIKVWTDGNRQVWFRKADKKSEKLLKLGRFDLLKRCSKWKLLHRNYSSGRKVIYDLKSETYSERE